MILLAIALLTGHIPDPDAAGTPSSMAREFTSSKKEIRQKKAKRKYKSIKAEYWEDSTYLGRKIPLDIKRLEVTSIDPITVKAEFYAEIEQVLEETLILFITVKNAESPIWAVYHPVPINGVPQEWGIYGYNMITGLYDERLGNASMSLTGSEVEIAIPLINEFEGRKPIVFLRTMSQDNEDWAWSDVAPDERKCLIAY